MIKCCPNTDTLLSGPAVAIKDKVSENVVHTHSPKPDKQQQNAQTHAPYNSLCFAQCNQSWSVGKSSRFPINGFGFGPGGSLPRDALDEADEEGVGERRRLRR